MLSQVKTLPAGAHADSEKLRFVPAPEAVGGDSGVYRCDCGQVFTASTTTHVTCPVCGHEQAW